MQFLIGFILSLIIALLAYYKKSLTLSGFIAAIISGTLIYGFGTYVIFSLLMFFFISSSLFTKLKDESKEKGRNAFQVFANSIVTVVFSLGYFLDKNVLYLVISAISIAACTADTWASEIGKLSKGKTRSIINLKEITKGESGGVSLLGTIASLIGSVFIAIIFFLLMLGKHEGDYNRFVAILTITLSGFLASLLDSILGVLIQEKYLNIHTGKIVEKFKKDEVLKLVSGIKFINNDMVNLLTSFIISTSAALIILL